MRQPLVSVVTPSLNQGRFIRATIESVLAQDYPALEYIVMDGGSTDETARIVADYASRLTWISEKDTGQSNAINKGFRRAHGEIVAWLNSDDLMLPGAVTTAVHALAAAPCAGAVYGEGYRIDESGAVKGRFPATEPFNLWKLVHVWDYILQQTVYFRARVLAEVGYLDESLHWGMDWDLLIRIAMRYPLVYVSDDMGALREYAEAKTFSGGAKRFAELAALVRRHAGKRFPPGYFIYGLDTYDGIWGAHLEKWAPAALRRLVRTALRYPLDRILRDAQGLHTGGWAAKRLEYMLPPGEGEIAVHGSLPGDARLRGQRLRVVVNGVHTAELRNAAGDFEVRVPVPAAEAARAAYITVSASKAVPVPGQAGPRAYLLKQITWAAAR